MADGLCMELKNGEEIVIEDRIRITVEKEKGSRVRLRFEAPRSVSVRRMARRAEDNEAQR